MYAYVEVELKNCEVVATTLFATTLFPKIFANLSAYEPISIELVLLGKILLKSVTSPCKKEEPEIVKVPEALVFPRT